MSEEKPNEESKAPEAKKAAPAAKAKEEKPAAKAKEEKPAAKAKEEKSAAKAKEEKPAAKAKEEKPDADAKEEAPAAEAKDENAQPKIDISAEAKGDGEDAPKIRKIKGSKNISNGIVHIKATFNNTVVCVSDMQGNVISWGSAGRAGFKGSRKSTAFAASSVTTDAAKTAISHGMNEVEVRVQGPGAGRESAIRAVQSAGLRVNAIKDVTPMPHNGCRPRKRRRV